MRIPFVIWIMAAVLSAPVAVNAGAPADAAAPAAAHKVKRESSAENSAGYKLMKERKYTEAIARLEKAVQIDPLNKTAWNNLGVCQLRMYETGLSGTPALEAAVAAFQKVAGIDPAFRADNLKSAQALVAQENAWAEAVAKRAGQPPKSVAATGDYRAYKAAGEAAEAEGDLALAQGNYEKAEAVAGSSKGKSAAANWQGLLALRSRNPKAAVEHLTRATTLDPASKYAWNNLGVALRRLYDAGGGDKELIEQAVAAFRKVGEIDPTYKPGNLTEAEEQLTALGGPSQPAEAAPAADAAPAGEGAAKGETAPGTGTAAPAK